MIVVAILFAIVAGVAIIGSDAAKVLTKSTPQDLENVKVDYSGENPDTSKWKAFAEMMKSRKWLYLFITIIALIVFGIIMFVLKQFGFGKKSTILK